MSTYSIKERLEKLGIKDSKIISLLFEKGIDCTASQFSRAVNGKSFSDFSRRICFETHKIISEIEKKLGA